MVRLGSGPGDMKLLKTDAMDRGIAALARMRRVAEAEGASLRAVATSAVREAENDDDLRAPGAATRRGSRSRSSRGSRRPGSSTSACFKPCRSSTGGYARRHRWWIDRALIGERGEVLASREPEARRDPSHRALLRRRARASRGCRRLPSVRALGAGAVRARSAPSSASRSSSAARARSWRSRRWSPSSGHESAPITLNNFELRRDEVDDVVGRLLARHRREAEVVPGPRPATGRHHPRRGDHPRAGHARVRRRRGWSSRTARLREGVLLDTVQRSHGGTLHHLRDLSRAACCTSWRSATSVPTTRARSLVSPWSSSTTTAPVHGLDERLVSTSRRRRCSRTSGSSSRTRSTTCTRTT